MNVQISSATQTRHLVPSVSKTDSSFNRIYRGLLASVGVALVLVSAPALAATAPSLGSESTYGIVSETYTNTVAGTTVNGTGSQPAVCYTTGPGVAPTVTGTVVTPCPPATGTDQGTALADLNSQACTSIGAAVALDAISIGGGTPGTFPPGCYSSTGAMSITTGTTVTLSGAGVYIFRPGGALNPAANSNVVAAGGACANDVFWAPVGGTTIGANSNFVGNIFRGTAAGLSITLGNSANLEGRALGFGSTVTTDTNTITVPSACAVLPAQLSLVKTVVNTGGGTALASAFTLTATGPSVISGTAPVAAADASVGVYTLTETNLAGYTAGLFSCSGGGTLVGNQLTIGAADAGNTITCTITNTFNAVAPAQLALAKTVVNTGGGTALASAFTLTAAGPTVISGTAPVAATNAPVGVYTLTETNLAGYTAGLFSCSGGGTLAGNLLTITAADSGNTITCTIVNTFNVVAPAQLSLVKTVVNTGGGTALASAFTLTATGPTVISGTAPVAATNAPVGVYTLTETGPAGYTAGSFSCSGGGALAGNLLTISAADAGNTITCTIANTFIVPPPPSAAASIPTLSEWAMLLLIFLMAIVGFAAMRRQAR